MGDDSTPTVEASAFGHRVRVYYEDTDAAGIVYYANYLKFIERARTEWLRAMAIELDVVARRDGVVFPVRSLEARYDRPARLGDCLRVTVCLGSIRRVDMTVDQQVIRGDDQLFSCRVRLACVDSTTFRPRPVPASMRDQILKWKTQSN